MKPFWMWPAKAGLIAIGILCVSAGSASAQFVTYSVRAAFDTAAGGGLSIANFQGLDNQSFQTLSHANQASIPAGVTFSSSGGGASDLFAAPAGFNGNSAIATTSLFANFFGTPLFASFSPNVSAVGADVIPFDFNGATATIAITVHQPGGGSTSYQITPPQGVSGFFGVIATGGNTIDQITYAPPSGFTAGVDNFEFGTAVPEPGSVAVFAFMSAGGLLARASSKKGGRGRR